MADFSLVEFAAFLSEAVTHVEHATHEGLEQAARIVEREAKAELGHYQDAAGPFQQWAELADSTKDDRVRQGYTENDPLLRDGTLRDSIEHRVDGHAAYVGSDNEIAVFQELGTERIPPRSFLAGALIRKEKEVAHVIGSHFVGGLFGNEVAEKTMVISGVSND